MTIKIELSEEDVKNLIADYIQSKVGDTQIDRNSVLIQTKSAQNYKSEWEIAQMKIVYIGSI